MKTMASLRSYHKEGEVLERVKELIVLIKEAWPMRSLVAQNESI